VSLKLEKQTKSAIKESYKKSVIKKKQQQLVGINTAARLFIVVFALVIGLSYCKVCQKKFLKIDHRTTEAQQLMSAWYNTSAKIYG